MEDWAEIRRLSRAEGMPIKAIARRLGVAGTRSSARWPRMNRLATNGHGRGPPWDAVSNRRSGRCSGSSRTCHAAPGTRG